MPKSGRKKTTRRRLTNPREFVKLVYMQGLAPRDDRSQLVEIFQLPDIKLLQRLGLMEVFAGKHTLSFITTLWPPFTNTPLAKNWPYPFTVRQMMNHLIKQHIAKKSHRKGETTYSITNHGRRLYATLLSFRFEVEKEIQRTGRSNDFRDYNHFDDHFENALRFAGRIVERKEYMSTGRRLTRNFQKIVDTIESSIAQSPAKR